MKPRTEHINETDIIDQTLDILNSDLTVEEILQEICNILPRAWSNSEYISTRITYQNKVFETNNIDGSSLVCSQSLEIPGKKNGTIELYVNKKYPGSGDNEFKSRAASLLTNIASLTSGSISKKILKDVLSDNKERLKELHAINQTNIIVAKGKSVNETLQEICDFLSKSCNTRDMLLHV